MEKNEFISLLKYSYLPPHVRINDYHFHIIKEYCLDVGIEKSRVEEFMKALINPMIIMSGLPRELFVTTIEKYKQKFEIITIIDKNGEIINHI